MYSAALRQLVVRNLVGAISGEAGPGREAIRDALDKHNLTISNINAFMMNAVADPRQPYWHPGWTDPDPHYRAIRREHTKRSLRLAAELGAKNVTTEPGGLLLGGQTWKQGDVLSSLILHQAHHRGQMTVLMRQAGLAVPGIYGPAKEEWAAMGMAAPK